MGTTLATETDWTTLIAVLERHPHGPRLSESTVSGFEERVGFRLPTPLRNLYLSLGNGFTPYFLPLLTGREDQTFEHLADSAEAFRQASKAFASVLGWHKANRSLELHGDEEDVWVEDLLLVADFGCAIYFAVDLADPNLRVIECEHFEPSENPELDAEQAGVTLAYTDDRVPRPLRGRFVVAASSLHEWLSRWVAHGSSGLRATWKADTRLSSDGLRG